MPRQDRRTVSQSEYDLARHIAYGKSISLVIKRCILILIQEWGLSFPAERLELARNTNKLGRFATVEDVAEQVKAFVVSKSVTGQNGVIDAGFGL